MFDPGQQATIHGDYHAFGSLFQFGRPADGHELVNYTNASTWVYKYTPTNVPATSYPNVGHGKTIIPIASTDHLGANNTPYWFGATAPAGFPVTNGDTNYAVCPSGFIIPQLYYLSSIINRTKASENMKEFAVRLPSNAFVSRDLGHNGPYAFFPNLWTSYYSIRKADGTPSATITSSTNYYYETVGAVSTDYRWNGTAWVAPNTIPGQTGALIATELPSWLNSYGIPGNNYNVRMEAGYYYTVRKHYIANGNHSPSSSFPIRCIKQ